MLPHARPPVSSPYPLPVCPLYLSRSVAVSRGLFVYHFALCLPCVYHYDYGSEPDYPGVRWSDSEIRSGAGERNLIFAMAKFFAPPPLQ